MHEILDRRPLLEEFRIADDVEAERDTALLELGPDDRADTVGSTYRYRGLRYHGAVIAHGATDFFCRLVDVRHVRRTVRRGRCADRDEEQFGPCCCLTERAREKQTASF